MHMHVEQVYLQKFWGINDWFKRAHHVLHCGEHALLNPSNCYIPCYIFRAAATNLLLWQVRHREVLFFQGGASRMARV